MLPQKQNPNAPEYDSQCQVLNEFITFILELDTSKPATFKSNALKVIECLKFIKVKLAFIAYAVEHRRDPKLYQYKADQRKGVIRDFYGASMHFNSYSSKELVKAGLKNLVQQFESAILRMREEESFAYQLEYDKEIGCIERRTAKALAYAAEYLSSKKDNLDDLMGQCGFSEAESDSESAFTKAYDFLKPYLGKLCIWNDSEYVLDEVLIKRYLTEVLDFNYGVPSVLSVGLIEDEPINLSIFKNIFKNGSLKDRLAFIEKMSGSQWDDFFKQPHGHILLYRVLRFEPIPVGLKLIDKVGPSTLEQELSKLPDNQIEAFYFESSVLYKALLEKINYIPFNSLSLKTKMTIYASGLKYAAAHYGDIVSLLYEGITRANRRIKALSPEGYLTKIFLYQSPELIIKFIAKIPKEFLSQLVLPLDLSQVDKRLPYLLLSKTLDVESSQPFYNYLKDYQPLRNKLVSHGDPLLKRCIDYYFEGKGEITSELKPIFIEGLEAKVSLSEKALAFLEVLQNKVPSVSTYPNNTNLENPTTVYTDLASDPEVVWKRGVLSWHHYRQLRLQQNNEQLQKVLDQLVNANLLFTGSHMPFADFYALPDRYTAANVVENDIDATQRAFTCIREIKGLVKIIKSCDWQLFVRQLEDLNYRPGLRCKAFSPTHKFVHLTNEIVPYQKKRQNKINYTHTKKTSTTLLSPKIATSVFGENMDEHRLLVGVLFDKEECKIKAMLLKDSGTVNHAWLGSKTDVVGYKGQIANINQTDWNLFVEEIKYRSHHNEVLAKVNKEALRAIVIARDTSEARRIAIKRCEEIKEKFAIDLPIIFYTSSLQALRCYTKIEQQDDKLAWQKNIKVCSAREQVSKDRLLTILNQSLNKSDWQFDWFGSLARIKNKSVPRTVTFIAKEVAKAYKSEQPKKPTYTWVEAEQKITDILIEKTTQGRFFKFIDGRSDDTVAFYKDLLQVVSKP